MYWHTLEEPLVLERLAQLQHRHPHRPTLCQTAEKLASSDSQSTTGFPVFPVETVAAHGLLALTLIGTSLSVLHCVVVTHRVPTPTIYSSPTQQYRKKTSGENLSSSPPH